MPNQHVMLSPLETHSPLVQSKHLVGQRTGIISIRPIEATNNYGELTRFEVDATTTSLRDVVERIHADPLLHCKAARVGTRLLTYEDDVTGDPIDMFNPAVALEPLAAIVPHLLPCAAANGLTEFAEGQELWLVVDAVNFFNTGLERDWPSKRSPSKTPPRSFPKGLF